MKTRVGNLFKRPLVMGDPNLVTGQEILVETNEDNQIVALKERKDNELSTIIAGSSEEESEKKKKPLDEFFQDLIAMGVKTFENVYSDPDITQSCISEEFRNQLLEYCKQYLMIVTDQLSLVRLPQTPLSIEIPSYILGGQIEKIYDFNAFLYSTGWEFGSYITDVSVILDVRFFNSPTSFRYRFVIGYRKSAQVYEAYIEKQNS